MHLALLLSKSSEDMVRAAVPDAGELCLIVIRSSEEDVKPPIGLVEGWWRNFAGESISECVEGLVRFGPENAYTWALKLRFRMSQGPDLDALRRVAESTFNENRISWLHHHTFSPHLTLVKTPMVTLHMTLPKMVRFDRFEWRK